MKVDELVSDGVKRFTESHEDTKRAAEARVLDAAESDDSVEGLFGSDGMGGILSDEVPPEDRVLFDGWPIPRDAADPRARLEAHAAGKAHAAYESAGAGSYPYPRAMNVVITFADAARTFAYR
jgi:hypothetical protein